MNKTRILCVVGARPNFMKMAPILREFVKHSWADTYLVHTGQHYDDTMSEVFFRDLRMKKADFNLQVGSASHAVQTAEIMSRFEQICLSIQPDLVIVAGDVNSTMACSLTAVKLQVPVAHIEAGLRSFDRTMPEEINRIVTDAVSELLFTTEDSANVNLGREGIAEHKIHYVGNTMIDSLVHCLSVLAEIPRNPLLDTVNGTPYFLATIHRPSNVDQPPQLSKVIDILKSASAFAPVIFVTHPRTRDRIQRTKRADMLLELNGRKDRLLQGRVYTLPPLSYFDFLRLMSGSTAVLTDSGGIQEETTFLKIPCLTMRENTERPVTVELGTNEIVGVDGDKILSCIRKILAGRWKLPLTPPLWDGRSAQRVVEVLKNLAIDH